jgi:hypothetical protein
MQGLGCRVQGLGCRVQGLRFEDLDLYGMAWGFLDQECRGQSLKNLMFGDQGFK